MSISDLDKSSSLAASATKVCFEFFHEKAGAEEVLAALREVVL